MKRTNQKEQAITVYDRAVPVVYGHSAARIGEIYLRNGMKTNLGVVARVTPNGTVIMTDGTRHSATVKLYVFSKEASRFGW